MPAPYKRRQILVDPDLQVGLSMNILGWLYFYVVAFALLCNAPSVWAVFTAQPSDPAYFEAVQRLQWFTQFTVLPLALTFAAVAVHGVVFTHRVAGPIYRIKMTLRDMGQRRFQARPVTLREKDYFKDVATDLTTVIESLREDAARRRRMNEETLAGAKNLVDALEQGRGARQEILAMAHLILDRAERMDRHLASSFTDENTPPSPAATAQAAPAAPAAAATAPAPAPAKAETSEKPADAPQPTDAAK
jgi:hypothetical protein